jgi:penicillin-binding protein 1A
MNLDFLKSLNRKELFQKIEQLPQRTKNYIQNWQRPTKDELIEWSKKAVKWGLIGGTALLFVVVIFYQSVRFGAFGSLPNEKTLKNIENDVASEVYSVDGKLLGRYFLENRTNVAYDNIAPSLIDALISTEDERFYKHNGVDRWSLFRVLFKSILLRNKNTGGGSTLTQQLAKNLFPRQRHGLLSMPVNKCREAIIAKRLEKVYSKKEILTLYLNTVPFGEDVYGINVAAQRFLSTDVAHLNIEQSALLAGLLQSPTAYNPRTHPDRALFRRNIVFAQMLKNDKITEAQHDSLIQKPLDVKYQYISHSDGLAPYFRAHLREEFKKFCQNYKKPDGTNYNIYTDGLKIHTTIHSKWQRYAEEAMREQMTELQGEFDKHWKKRTLWKSTDRAIKSAKKQTRRYKILKEQGKSEAEINANFAKATEMHVFNWEGKDKVSMSPMDSIIHYHSLLNAGFLATDPKTGQVRAWVGGITHEHLQYDHVKALRQAGSVFKPILYTSALQNGYSPCSFIENQKVIFANHENWSPNNADAKYGGWYTLKGGLANSVNTIAAQLIEHVGTEEVVDLAQKMGIESEITNTPSLALGATDVHLMELAEAYGVFANRGNRVALHYLLKIEDKDGNVLYEDKEDERVRSTEIFSEDIADQIRGMMQGVVDSGTARSIRYRYGINAAIAGKTGTTQKQADGRFVGFTPNVVAAAWVGGADRRVRFRSLRLGSGGHTALPIWARFYKKMMKDPDFKNWENSTFAPISDSLNFDCPNFTLSEEELFEVRERDDESFLERLFNIGDDNEAEAETEEVIVNERPNRHKAPRKFKKEKEKKLKKWWEKQRKKWRN